MHGRGPGVRSRSEVFVLEDDRDVREMLSDLLAEAGYDVICFADSCALLTLARERIPACFLLDVFVPGRSGLELLRELHREQYPAPILMISGLSDVATAVSAIKLGAADFIEKPLRGPEIVSRVNVAIESWARRQGDEPPNLEALHFPGAQPLSKREREVLEQFVAGASTKEAARALGISPRTVEDHRSRIMSKVGARNSADLIRIVMTRARPSS